MYRDMCTSMHRHMNMAMRTFLFNFSEQRLVPQQLLLQADSNRGNPYT